MNLTKTACILISIILLLFCCIANRVVHLFGPENAVIEYPKELNLGDHELGDFAISEFLIANKGTGFLIIDNITSNCSCAGLEIKENDKYLKINDLKIGPGKATALRIRISIRGVPPNSKLINVIGFNTNDHSSKHCEIKFVINRVKSGIFTIPGDILVNTIPLNSVTNFKVEVKDDSVTPRIISKVTARNASLLTAVFKKTDYKFQGSPKTIGEIYVTINTTKPCEINERIQIDIYGREDKPNFINVMGKVGETAEIYPSAITLPRFSSSGPIYSFICVFRFKNSESVKIFDFIKDPRITIKLLPSNKINIASFEASIDPVMVQDMKKFNNLISFKAKINDIISTHEVPVVILN